MPKLSFRMILRTKKSEKCCLDLQKIANNTFLAAKIRKHQRLIISSQQTFLEQKALFPSWGRIVFPTEDLKIFPMDTSVV
jgi:hypothetical protein